MELSADILKGLEKYISLHEYAYCHKKFQKKI